MIVILCIFNVNLHNVPRTHHANAHDGSSDLTAVMLY